MCVAVMLSGVSLHIRELLTKNAARCMSVHGRDTRGNRGNCEFVCVLQPGESSCSVHEKKQPIREERISGVGGGGSLSEKNGRLIIDGWNQSSEGESSLSDSSP